MKFNLNNPAFLQMACNTVAETTPPQVKIKWFASGEDKDTVVSFTSISDGEISWRSSRPESLTESFGSGFHEYALSIFEESNLIIQSEISAISTGGWNAEYISQIAVLGFDINTEALASDIADIIQFGHSDGLLVINRGGVFNQTVIDAAMEKGWDVQYYS